MKIVKLALSATLAAFAMLAHADVAPATANAAHAMTPAELAIKQLVEKRLGENAKVESVHKTNFSGLYEVASGGEVMYTDEHAKYLILGQVIDMETHKNYTRESVAELNKIKFSDLPLNASIKMVKGNGKRVVAVFEDPNCGYCKKLRHTLADMDNVTVYTFMYNIIAPTSADMSKNIWCTPNRVKAWDDWMLSGKAPAAASASCISNPNDQVLALGHKLHITATPTIFFADGTRTPGLMERDALEAKWSSLQ